MGARRAIGPRSKNVPNWKDWAVRLAAAYDLFGTGKTAIKVNASKYVASAALGFAEAFNTMTAATETRTWNDADGNRSVLDASGNRPAQRDHRRHRELRPGV